MKLYHGSNQRIEEVDLSLSQDFKDFGTGFYLTPDFQRAVLMANRRKMIENEGEATVNPFIFTRSTCKDDIKIKEFKKCDSEWALFILLNRDKEANPPFRHDFDIVIGPVADGRIDSLIYKYKAKYKEDYMERENLQKLANKLKYPGEPYIQYCFCTEDSLKYLFRD